MRRRLIWYIAGAVVLATVVVVYALADPAQSHLFPRCGFLWLTGYKCPGCGSQRALHALFNGDIAGAFAMNAALVCAIPPLAVMFVAEAFPSRMGTLHRMLNSRTAIWTWASLLCAWWIGRNLFNL